MKKARKNSVIMITRPVQYGRVLEPGDIALVTRGKRKDCRYIEATTGAQWLDGMQGHTAEYCDDWFFLLPNEYEVL